MIQSYGPTSHKLSKLTHHLNCILLLADEFTLNTILVTHKIHRIACLIKVICSFVILLLITNAISLVYSWQESVSRLPALWVQWGKYSLLACLWGAQEGDQSRCCRRESQIYIWGLHLNTLTQRGNNEKHVTSNCYCHVVHHISTANHRNLFVKTKPKA